MATSIALIGRKARSKLLKQIHKCVLHQPRAKEATFDLGSFWLPVPFLDLQLLSIFRQLLPYCPDISSLNELAVWEEDKGYETEGTASGNVVGKIGANQQRQPL